MEETILYKLTDSLFIYRDKDGKERLIYIAGPSQEHYIQIINMKEIENNVNIAIKRYAAFFETDAKENLNKTMLFIFLLKVKLYEEYILRILLGHMLFDEYDQLTKDNKLASIIAEYLLNKEPLSKVVKDLIKGIIEDTNKFNKLYSLFKDVTFGMPKYYIEHIYREFLFVYS